MKKDFPALVAAFEQLQAQREGQPAARVPEQPSVAADEALAMREQLAALMVKLSAQEAQLQQLKASPSHSSQQSPALVSSRFAKKEPRAQDLREYDGTAAKLDEWLQELSLATHLFQLNTLEASSFAVSRLRGAALGIRDH
jgi:hypothetical protein